MKDSNLLDFYMTGFNDELNNKSPIVIEHKLLTIAYNMGRSDAIIGDGISPNETILNRIKSHTWYNEGKVKPILELLTHQDFKVLGSFNVEPSKEEIFEIIEKVYNKKVIDFERLDSENFLFNFEDNSSIELLLRDCKF